jgi:exosortase/archaeosortase family protein
MIVAEKLKPHITEVTNHIITLYRNYKELADRLLILALTGSVAAVVLFISGFFMDDVILRLRDGMFSLVLAGVKLTLNAFGYELAEQNIPGVLQIAAPLSSGTDYSSPLIISHSKLHIRYYMLAVIVLFISIKDIKKAAVAALASVPVLFVLSVFVMSVVTVNAGELNGDTRFTYLFKSIVIAGLAATTGYRYLQYKKKIIKEQNSETSEIIKKLRRDYQPIFILNLILLYSFLNVTLIYQLSEFLISTIHHLTKWMLIPFGYAPEIFGRNIKGDNAWLYMAPACLGMRISTVFIIVIFMFKGKLLTKILFSLTGFFLITLLNATRMTFLYIYVSKNDGVYLGQIDVHDLFNYPVYLAVIVMWLVYLKWFGKGQSKGIAQAT